VTTLNLEAYQHFFKGEELLNKIQEEEAVAEFQKAIALDSTFGLAYYRLGYTLHFFSRAGETDEARTALSQALALLDRMPEKEQYIARAYLAHLGHTPKELEAGLAILREMEKLYPEDKELIFFIGDWSYHNVQFATAKKYLERVLTLDPDFRRALMHLFLTYRDMGNYQGTLKVAKQMQNLTNSDGLSYRMLGTAYGRLAQYKNAVINLKKGLTVSPDLDLYRELGYVYFQQDSLEQAIRILGQALELEQTDIWSKYLLANVLVKQNLPSRAEAFARKFAAENAGFHGENLLAWVLVAAHIDFDEAVLFAEKAMSAKPLRYPDRLRAIPYYPLPEHTLGLAYLQMREYRRAVEFLEVAEQLAPLRENIKNDLQAAQRQLRLESNK
jgi:tetratricopeptide (TPR) repeat protein